MAFLLSGIAPSANPCIASALVIYAVYTLDRTIPCAEDRVNQLGCWNADRRAGVVVCATAYAAGALLFAWDGLLLVPLLPLITGYLYTRGVSIAGRSLKLKRGAGVKNLVIGLTWGASIALVIAHWASNAIVPCCILLFFGVKLFINSTLFDMKDMEGDLSAGIRTIPACLGVRRSRLLLAFLSLILHLAMALLIFQGYIRPESIIIGYSGLIGVLFISLYSVEWEHQTEGVKRYLRQLFIDGESTLSLFLRFFTGMLQVAIFPGSI
ncbi:MAG: UbiA family prenyltransferase [Methanomicrobiales archaeon]|nr:UbiA family prenyltransferase [Methanomicrobiales archaeon]